MKKVLILGGHEGHWSLTQSVSHLLKESSFDIQIIDPFSASVLKIYSPFYRYVPFLFKIPYKMGDLETIQKAVKLYMETKLDKQIKNLIKDYQPDLIISTYFLNNFAIAKILDYQKKPIPFLNVVANPWTINPLEFLDKACLNLVYDDRSRKIGTDYGFRKETIQPIGWLVRPEFYKLQNAQQIRANLGFDNHTFTLLICGGSEGTNMILKVLPAFLTVNKPLQVIIVCGANKTLFKTLTAFKKVVKRLNHSRFNQWKNLSYLNFKLLSFTDRLPELMSIADLVIGKAGPNLLFETIASLKPFMAICHISGQEDGNLDLIKKKNLGFVEENPLKAISLLKQIIDRPQILTRFQKSIHKEHLYNKNANHLFIQTVKSLLR